MCAVAALLMGQVGCATRPVPVTARTPSIEEQCEAYAKEGVTATGQPPTAVNMIEGLALTPVAFLGALMVPFGHLEGLGAVALPFKTVGEIPKNARHNRGVHEAALDACLTPMRLEQRLGPNHPDVAQALYTLANRYAALADALVGQASLDSDRAKSYRDAGYADVFARRATTMERQAVARRAAAEPLYKRVLMIREEALGPTHLDIAVTLEAHAALLRKMNHDTEAVGMEARAKAIRATHEHRDPEGLQPESSASEDDQNRW